MGKSSRLVTLYVLIATFHSAPNSAHVALTYPPARKYDLDFLDNGRTPAPCGMPKGDIRTSVIQGSLLNVTWHLAYPHQGGFYLELLDQNEQHFMFLTPGGRFIANDSTAQHFEVRLPSEMECRNCTLRLIREAAEWGARYRFWSCADVDILPRSEVKRDCNGNGRYFSNRCLCNTRFYGAECQFENECEEDGDCGARFGKCVDVDATSYPKKQCFCSRGTYGDKCSKVSHIRSETQINLGLFSRRNLSDALTLYWRILKKENELELVLVNKGTSYAAVGWRPANAKTSCRQFPELDGPPPPKKFVSVEPKPAIEPASEPEPNSEPEPEGEPEPKPENKNAVLFFQEFFTKASGDTSVKTTTEQTDAAKVTTLKQNDSPTLSLADRLANFGRRRRRKRSALTEGSPLIVAAPLLKPARRATKKPRSTEAPAEPTQAAPEPTEAAETEPEPQSTTSTSNGDLSPVTATKQEVRTDPVSTSEQRTGETDSGLEPTADTLAEPEPRPSATPKDPKKTSPVESERESRAGTKPEPEPNAEVEPEPLPDGEPEPEAKGEPEPEPHAEGEPGPEPKAEAEGEPEPEPEAEGEPEPEPEAEGEPEPESASSEANRAYYPFDRTLHPMDCTDIVIGMVRGSFYRAFDYYTRDRSTPRRDDFWGGEDSLTAVFGWEKDGETTIMIRKNLTASHPSDHDVEDGLMHLIWARGQEPNMYVHVPKSGLEEGTASQPAFYRPNELKYHGRKDQRGVTTINFFEGKSPLTQAGSEQINWCGGQWKYPHLCSVEKGNCDYSARWEFMEETDEIAFTVSSSNTKLWTGIGFSDDTSMRKTDIILGWLNPSTGKYFMYDGWLRSYTPPVVDTNQGIANMSASQKDGITTLNFSRKRESKDKQDLSFTDSKCLYLIFPVKGGVVNFVNKRISKHQLTPTVSSQRICIRSCAKFGGADGKPIVFTTTPRPPQLVYDVSFEITNAGERLEIPKIGSDEYTTLVNQILTSSEPMYQKIPGFVVADVSRMELAESKAVKVITRVTLNKEMYEEKNGPMQSKEEEDKSVQAVHDLVHDSVKSGQIGHLRVNPDFLTVNLLEAKDQTAPVTETEVIEDKTLSLAEFTAQNKYWFIGAAILALILLALLQCLVTMCRKKRNQPPPVSSKERLITNSRWRDYSRGATNYAYETYETYETEGESEARRAPSLRREPESPHKNGGRGFIGGNSNGHMNGRFATKEMNGSYGGLEPKSLTHSNYDHTRSLQRPRNPPPPTSSVLSDPRTTYSLPRGGSANSSPPSYSTAMQDLTPDFYYLPSQRKYSGEVVRVYVDYNQPK